MSIRRLSAWTVVTLVASCVGEALAQTIVAPPRLQPVPPGAPVTATSQPAATPVPANAPQLPMNAAIGPAADPTSAANSADQAKQQTAKQAEEQKRQQRLQRLMQTPFDRRPSTILQVWSRPTDEDDEPVPMKGRRPNPMNPEQQPPQANDKVTKELDAEIKSLQRNVTLGDWQAVAQYLAALPIEDGKAVYQQMLTILMNPPNQPNPFSGGRGDGNIDPRLIETNAFSNQDILDLAAAAPAGFDEQTVTLLGNLLRLAITRGQDNKDFVRRLGEYVRHAPSESPLLGLWPARLLIAAGSAVDAGGFLPDIKTAAEEKDAEALNLLAIHCLALHAKNDKLVDLERAWEATQAILGLEKTKSAERLKALTRAIELVPKVRKELGEQWLADGFTKSPERGRQILASIGSLASAGGMAAANNPGQRQKYLEFQRTVIETLLAKAPELANDWRDRLTLLAINWLREAEFSYQRDLSRSSGPQMQRDIYGNLFWSSGNDDSPRNFAMNNVQGGAPIAAGEVLKLRPSDAWIERVDPSLLPRFQEILAKLFLKVDDEDAAFPFIEKIAKTHPDKARELVNEFLRVWTDSHDPNASRRRQNPYIWFYGFEQRANGIPLTRSKQERNLKDLAELVAKLKKLNVGDIDEETLARAFTTSHSQAEVYRLDAIESVFGSLDGLKPRTIAALAQQMRENLGGAWRSPATQEKNKTNRKQKDIQAEVSRGYDVALNVVAKAQAKCPDDWRLQLAKAALLHDLNDYRQTLSKSSDYAPARRDALAEFQKAAALYAAGVDKLAEKDRTTEPFDFWFYASLGAVDLGQITEERRPDLSQFKLVREAMLALPGVTAEWHMASFANSLFTRMSAAKPAIKVRYLKAGFEIVGDHERAAEAKKVFDYYNDLVTEIKLETKVDGSDVVGSDKPFGVFVNIRHTREIERESGGFAKYLQNQNSSRGFYWNYGRPLEDYRDKFQNVVNQALGEQFEVKSVTFQKDDVHSKAGGDYGWRVTPYAYLLLQAKKPEVDRIPPLQLDLDFLDTTGYAVIPIASPPLVIDAKAKNAEARPAANIKITQTLDERQSKDGKLLLEVKATSYGLVPNLDQLLDLTPPGFVVTNIDDPGPAVVEFASDVDDTSIVSERTWQVALAAAPGQSPPAKEFHFGRPRGEVAEMIYQRYQDADLKAVKDVVSLEAQYAKPSYAWVWFVAAGAAGVIAVVVVLVALLARRRPAPSAAFHVPESLTPFTVLHLLRSIDTKDGLAPNEHAELAETINRVERFYFAEAEGPPPDLKGIAETWVGRISKSTHR